MTTPQAADAAPPLGSALRVAHVSDLHVGAEDDVALEGLAADLHAAGATATIVTGDLTMRARSAQFQRAKEVIDQFPCPTMVVLGNHDLPLANPVRRLTSPYDAFRTTVTDELDPVLDLGSVRIQGLGSMPRWRWKSGRVSERQAELVRSTFADAPEGVTRVVAMHHPPSSEDLEYLAGRGEFEKALVEAEVDVILAGHTHVPAVQVLHVQAGGRSRSIVEVVAGTATSHRTRGTVRSWSLLELSATALTVTEHFAETDRWRPGPPQTFALPPGSHRPIGA